MASCSNRVFPATDLTGGTAGCLDDIRDAVINDGDMAVVIVDSTTEVYVYAYDVSSSDIESSPDVIKPDTNPTLGRWILQWSTVYTGIINEAKEWTAQQNFNEKAITSSSQSVAWDLDVAQTAVHVMTENTTIANPTNQNAGGMYILRVVQGSGPYTLAWGNAYDWGAQSASAAPAANADVIIVSFYSDGTNMYSIESVISEA
jgi:hypothetical protein